jgi:hypothetical protein
MAEMVAGDFDLSAKQLEAIVATVKKKNRVYQADYYQRQVIENRDGLRARQRENELRFRQNAPDKVQKK